MPVNKIKNLRDVIDFDPHINEGLFEIIRGGEQEDKKFEVRCSTPSYCKPGYIEKEKRRKSKATAKLAEFCIVAQGLNPEHHSLCNTCVQGDHGGQRLHFVDFFLAVPQCCPTAQFSAAVAESSRQCNNKITVMESCTK